MASATSPKYPRLFAVDMSKKSFLLYNDSLDVLDELTSDQIVELFFAIRDFNNGIEPKLDGLMKAVFIPFKNQFIRNSSKYESVRDKRIAAGKKGGIKSGKSRSKTKQIEANEANASKRSKTKQTKQTQANEAVNVNVNVNDNVNVSDIYSAEIAQLPKEDLKNSNLFRQPKIPTMEQVIEQFRQKGGTEDMAKRFYQKHDSTGWYLNNSPIIKWQSLINSYIANWKDLTPPSAEDIRKTNKAWFI